ncbi:hypothetical protein CNR37_00138 [Pseudomonas phage ventosus]|uniref:Uncharacterized protein n=1 Tax=Pseudomonas phage ventosus TaxID=2048980 RepID=A0A2H4P840_9CAUD|nr:hypothetical protein CNR37_00138 [Pseudomonas phage ventosus]
MKVGFFGVLGLIFIVLKLTGNIAWSWALVLLPLYGPFVALLIVAIIVGLLGAVLK